MVSRVYMHRASHIRAPAGSAATTGPSDPLIGGEWPSFGDTRLTLDLGTPPICVTLDQVEVPARARVDTRCAEPNG